MKNVDLDEPTSYLDHVNVWVVLNVNANRVNSLLRSVQKCLNHVILLVPLKN